MITNNQVRILMKNLQSGKSLVLSAAKSGMCPKSARKYRDSGQMPSECVPERNWKTRKDPFESVFEDEVVPLLESNPRLQAKTVLDFLSKKYPGSFQGNQLRTLQRRFRQWRALHGPPKEIYFPQIHKPGELCASDFTRMNDLDVSINGERFEHMLFHFVLTYSNWEDFTICYSENFESLSTGLQNALTRLGGVPKFHRTDRMSAAVNKPENPREFTHKYSELLTHYKLEGQKIQAGCANENGDVEKSHDLLKTALDQALMIRGSRDFVSLSEYESFLREIVDGRNQSKASRFLEEQKLLRELPHRRIHDFQSFEVKVDRSSRIRIQKRSYSLHSRLIGEMVRVQLHSDHLKVFLGNKQVETLPRLVGKSMHRISYIHVIDSLMRKPGAFENYQYREDMFPTSTFKLAFEALRAKKEKQLANKEYLKILNLAAKQGEEKVSMAILCALSENPSLSFESVKATLESSQDSLMELPQIEIEPIAPGSYDSLLQSSGELLGVRV